MIYRAADAIRLNEILNHPAVRPWVALGDGVLDLSEAVANRRNHVLIGEYGAICFFLLQQGVYEIHTQILPEGRGTRAVDLTAACAKYMFTRTDAYELVTRVPREHRAAAALSVASGLRKEFTISGAARFRERITDADVYSLRVQNWAARAPGLVERGKWLHRRMAQEAERLGLQVNLHEDDDESHDRYAGAAAEMAFGGQSVKGAALYNRWVSLARHMRDGKLQFVEVISTEPVIARFDLGLMRFHQDDIEILVEETV